MKWDVIIDSSIEGVKKPDKPVYRLAEKRAGFHGNEVVLVDNSQRNIEGARALGWTTFLYNPADPRKSSADLMAWLDGQEQAR